MELYLPSLREMTDSTSKYNMMKIIPVVEFSKEGYKIRKVFGKKSIEVKRCQKVNFLQHPNLYDFFFIEEYIFLITSTFK